MNKIDHTIVAIATPQGEGALGIIRLSGNKAIEIVDTMFINKSLIEQKSHTIHFGSLRNASGEILDEVVISLYHNPHSYTGEDVVEISCHGSSYIIQKIIQVCLDRGAQLAEAGEFTMRAYLNGKLDLSQAEAVADLIASDSKVSHEIAIKQMRGGFSKDIKRLRDELIHFTSMIELELDFGEEDVEFADRAQFMKLLKAIYKLVVNLKDSFELGNVLKNGVPTVIVGKPNAGKSTLLNGLINEERAIVSDIAGTTRDTIEETVTIQGIVFRLIDTAGIRETEDYVESIGVEKALEKIQEANLVLYLFDVTTTTQEQLVTELSELPTANTNYLLIANKTDLVDHFKLKSYESKDVIAGENLFGLSASDSKQINLLKEHMHKLVYQLELNKDLSMVSNIRHFEALQKTAISLKSAMENLDNDLSMDLIAIDVKQAIHYLGLITGEISTDDLLENIFRNFCIGK